MKKFFLVVLLLMVTFLFTLFVFSPVFYQRDVIVVPDVINHDIDYAIEEIKSNKLVVEITYLDSNEKKNSVIETIPTMGNLVKEGSVVKVNVSNGMLEQRMINVMNQYYSDVIEKIKNFGLQSKVTIVEIDDETLPNQYVKRQYPKENEIIKPGDEIILFVTKAVKYQVIPSMTYWSKIDVEEHLKNMKLNIVFAYEYNSRIAEGKVIRQSIPGNTEILLNKQNSIIVTISLGPDTSYIPDIIDMAEAEAIVLLDKLGITYEVNYVLSNQEKGRVIEIWKEANSDILKKVTLIVSGGKNEKGVSD